MITQLMAEKQDEIKHKDFCVEEFNTNQLQTERKEREKADLLALIEELTQTIKTLTADIDTLKSEIADLSLEMKRGGEDREKENAGGVMKMIQEIIDDAKNMEAEAIRAEEDSQKSYEDFVKDSNASIQAKSKEMTNKIEEKAKAEKDLNQANEDKDAALLELEQLSNYNAELHQSCDFIMKNFEIRQTGRDEEIEALKQAKSILSGAKFIQLLTQA